MRAVLFANSDWYLYNYRLPLAGALRQNGYEVILLSPAGRYSQRLCEAGFIWREFPLTRRGLNPAAEISTLWRLVRAYREIHPGVVHHFTIKCIIYGSIAAKIIGISKIINAVTGLGFVFTDDAYLTRVLRGFVLLLYRFSLRNTEAVFQNSDDTKLFLRQNVVLSDQTKLIKGSGVDVDYFRPSEEADGVPVILFPARLLWHKGIGELIDATKILQEAGIKVRIALGGDIDEGNPASISRELLEAWQSAGLVEWWGWQNDMRPILRKASIICLPSYREGIPKVLLEAGASGRAVITTDVPGCREVVRHNENGLLVPAKDSEALAKAMKMLIDDPNLRREMGKRGRKIVMDEYSQEKIINQTLALYNSLWSKPHAVRNV